MDVKPPRRRLLRPVAGWLPAVVLVPAATVLAVTLTAPDDDLAAMRDQHPLDLGTTWVYDVFDHGAPSGTRTSQVVGSASLLLSTGEGLTSAAELTRTYSDYPGAGARRTTSYLGVVGRTMLQYGQEEHDTFREIVPPIPAYRLPSRPGVSWSYDGLVGEDEFRSTTELTEIVDLEVGGHTFRDCAHFVSTIPFEQEGQPSGDEVLDEWTCPGYGPVRSVDRLEALDVEITEELTAFHGVTANWYAEGHAPGRAETRQTVGGTEGFDTARSYSVPDAVLGRDPAWTQQLQQELLVPPSGDADLLVLAEPDGQVTARSNDTGEVRWRTQLSGPVLATPVVAGDRVFVADSAKRVWALSSLDGTALWVRELGDVVSASPTLTGSGLAAPTDDGKLSMLDATDGSTRWEVQLAGAVRTAPAYDGAQLQVGDRSGTVTSLDPSDGDTRWSQSLDEGLSEGPVVAGDLTLAADGAGVVHAWTRDGEVSWESRGRGLHTAPLTATGDLVLTTTVARRLTAFGSGSGDRRWTRELPELLVNPVVVGDEVAVVTKEGALLVLDAADGHEVERWPLPLPTGDSTSRVEVQMALVDGALVIASSVRGELVKSVLYAYPVTAEPSSAAGVLLDIEMRPLPGLPNEAVVMAGDDVVAGVGSELLRVDLDGTTTVLAHSEEVQPGAAVHDGVVVTRSDDRVVAVRLDGTELWSAPGGAASLGAVPALDDDNAYFGVAGQGLVAVDLRSGERRWSTEVADQLTNNTPLVLPDGDVVYGGGGLARFDGTSGELRWRDPDAHLIGPAAQDGGIVLAYGVSPTGGPSGIGAWDAATGARLWLHEQHTVPLFLGPVVSEGVVVAADDAGHVTAYDVQSGAPLWDIMLRGSVAGSPVVQDGHVYLSEALKRPELLAPDTRVSVHDLRTGRFLGSWDAHYAPVTRASPIVGAGPDGSLLYPTSFGLVEVTAR